MAKEIYGYTMSLRSTWGEDAFVANTSGVMIAVDADYEQGLWDMLDVMDANMTTNQPGGAPYTPKLVRHEREDIELTHP